MNAQEIFDKVATHLFTQGIRAIDSTSTFHEPICAYRTSENLSCAVGCLIPDELYDDRMEGFNFDRDFVTWFKLPQYFQDHEMLLMRLQFEHDTKVNWNSTKAMRSSLKKVAKDYKLSPAILDTLEFNAANNT